MARFKWISIVGLPDAPWITSLSFLGATWNASVKFFFFFFGHMSLREVGWLATGGGGRFILLLYFPVVLLHRFKLWSKPMYSWEWIIGLRIAMTWIRPQLEAWMKSYSQLRDSPSRAQDANVILCFSFPKFETDMLNMCIPRTVVDV